MCGIKEHYLLCPDCAEKLNDRWAFFQLMHKIKGEHKCENCGEKFSVTFVPAEGGK